MNAFRLIRKYDEALTLKIYGNHPSQQKRPGLQVMLVLAG
jgi:hypothetical protein